MEQLLLLILKRLKREEQLTPRYAGIFESVKAMPEGHYPAIFFWVDRSQNNAIQITINKPLIEHWLAEDCASAGLKASEADRLAAVEVFARTAIKDAEIDAGAIIDQAGGLANLKAVEI